MVDLAVVGPAPPAVLLALGVPVVLVPELVDDGTPSEVGASDAIVLALLVTAPCTLQAARAMATKTKICEK